jgi:hypothetical protein
VIGRLAAYLLGVCRHRPTPPKWRGLDGRTYRGWLTPVERAEEAFLADVRRLQPALSMILSDGPLASVVLDLTAERHGLRVWRADARIAGRVRDILWGAEGHS